MKIRRFLPWLLFPLCLAAAPLDPAAPPEAWRERLAALAAPRTLVVPFTEARRTALKKNPVVVEGVARLAPGRGLSLDYSAPDSPLVILDAEGLLLRRPDGRDQAAPPEAAAALRPLHALLAFDLPLLGRSYAIDGEEGADGRWSLLLTRRDGDASPYRRIVVDGAGDRLTRIELTRAERQVVEIALDAPRPEALPPDDIARYFR